MEDLRVGVVMQISQRIRHIQGHLQQLHASGHSFISARHIHRKLNLSSQPPEAFRTLDHTADAPSIHR